MKTRYVRGLTPKPVLQKIARIKHRKNCSNCKHLMPTSIVPAADRLYICQKNITDPITARTALRFGCEEWEEASYTLAPDHIWL